MQSTADKSGAKESRHIHMTDEQPDRTGRQVLGDVIEVSLMACR